MRFFCMHKVDAKMEAGEPPSQAIIQAMGAFIGPLANSGVFLDGNGLHRSATRARVAFEGSTPVIERGPYAGRNELLAAFALISTTGLERAIQLATELGRASGNREVEVGPVVERWDIMRSTRPSDAPYRYLLLLKGDAAFEGGADPWNAAATALLDRWKGEGVVQSVAGLRPSGTGARSTGTGGKRRWTDGPFAESKELVAGFSILELPSVDAAKRLADEYAAILGDNEVELREVRG